MWSTRRPIPFLLPSAPRRTPFICPTTTLLASYPIMFAVGSPIAKRKIAPADDFNSPSPPPKKLAIANDGPGVNVTPSGSSPRSSCIGALMPLSDASFLLRSPDHATPRYVGFDPDAEAKSVLSGAAEELGFDFSTYTGSYCPDLSQQCACRLWKKVLTGIEDCTRASAPSQRSKTGEF